MVIRVFLFVFVRLFVFFDEEEWRSKYMRSGGSDERKVEENLNKNVSSDKVIMPQSHRTTRCFQDLPICTNR